MKKSDIGLIGLAVMGENLALNMERHGWQVSVYNRTVIGIEEGVVDRFITGRGKDKNFVGFTELKDFVQSLATPRKIMMMVNFIMLWFFMRYLTRYLSRNYNILITARTSTSS